MTLRMKERKGNRVFISGHYATRRDAVLILSKSLSPGKGFLDQARSFSLYHFYQIEGFLMLGDYFITTGKGNKNVSVIFRAYYDWFLSETVALLIANLALFSFF